MSTPIDASVMEPSEPSSPDDQPESAQPCLQQQQQQDGDWKSCVEQRQQTIMELIGDRDWDCYRKKFNSICNVLLTGWCSCHENGGLCETQSELICLKRKLGFALFGPGDSLCKEDNEFTGYNAKQLDAIGNIFNNVVKEQKGDKILMAPVFVFLKGPGGEGIQYPVFRIPNPQWNVDSREEEHWFVDDVGRVYTSWHDYTKNNLLPKSEWCFPKDGVYSLDAEGKLQLCFGKTSACHWSRAFVKGLDITTGVAGIGTAVVALTSPWIPFAVGTGCAVTAAATGVYGLVRSSVAQADRGNHGQTIGLRNRESQRNWLCIVGSALSMGAAGGMRVVAIMAQEGRVISGLGTGVVTGLNWASAAVNFAGIVENGVTLAENYKRNDLTTLECCQFGASVLFFANSVVNIKTARTLYKETQSQVIESHKASLRSNRHRKMFDGLAKETLKRTGDSMKGTAKVIKGINHISNPDEFYSTMIRSKKDFSRSGVKVSFEENGLPSIKSSGLLPEKLLSVVRDSATLPVSTSNTCGSLKPSIPANGSASTFVSQLPEGFKRIDTYLKSVGPREIGSVMIVLESMCRNIPYGNYLLQAFNLIREYHRCEDWKDCIHFFQEVMSFVETIFKNKMEGYNQDFDAARQSESFSEAKFNASQGLSEGVTPQDFFIRETLREVTFVPELLLSFGEDQNISEEELYYFPEHRTWGPNGELEVEEYLLIGQNVLGIPNVESSSICHDECSGGSTAQVYFDSVGIVIISSKMSDRLIGIRKLTFPEKMEIDT